MATAAVSKHERNSAKTRDKLITAAEELFGERSIDGVSLREITAKAGQKNPNALQYHFQNRDGLLQAIVDKHATEVSVFRNAYLERAQQHEWPPAEAAARCLVMPIIQYIESNPSAVNYVKIVSQITALNQMKGGQTESGGVVFVQVPGLKAEFDTALKNLTPRESHRRIFLAVNTAFHAIADIYRAGDSQPSSSPISARRPMVDQLICMLASFLAAGPAND